MSPDSLNFKNCSLYDDNNNLGRRGTRKYIENVEALGIVLSTVWDVEKIVEAINNFA